MKSDHNYHIQLDAWTYLQKKTTRTGASDLFPDAMKMSAMKMPWKMKSNFSLLFKKYPFFYLHVKQTFFFSLAENWLWVNLGWTVSLTNQAWKAYYCSWLSSQCLCVRCPFYRFPLLANSDTLGRRVILKCKILCTQVTIDKFIYLAREQIIESKQALL